MLIPRWPPVKPRFIPLSDGTWVVRFYKTELATGLPAGFDVRGATWREAWANSRPHNLRMSDLLRMK